jgi:hypothetical protein
MSVSAAAMFRRRTFTPSLRHGGVSDRLGPPLALPLTPPPPLPRAGMFRLPRVELLKMLRTSPLGRYAELGACAWYAAFKEDGPQPEEIQSLLAGIGSTVLTTPSPTFGGLPDIMGGLDKLASSAAAFDKACKVRSIALRYMCAGMPLGAYKTNVGAFTRAALSIGVNATIAGSPANYQINLCVDMSAAGPVPCGSLPAALG